MALVIVLDPKDHIEIVMPTGEVVTVKLERHSKRSVPLIWEADKKIKINRVEYVPEDVDGNK